MYIVKVKISGDRQYNLRILKVKVSARKLFDKNFSIFRTLDS